MRIRKRSLFPLPPLSHLFLRLNPPSKSPPQQRQQHRQQKKEARPPASKTKAEAREGNQVQGLHSKGDRFKHIRANHFHDSNHPKQAAANTNRSPLSDPVKKRNRCMISDYSTSPNHNQIKVSQGEDDEERLNAINNNHKENSNSKSWGAAAAAGGVLGSYSSSHIQDGRWRREAPLKSMIELEEEEKHIMVKEKKKKISKKKMNEKDGDEEEEEEETDGVFEGSFGKKRGSGNGSNSSNGSNSAGVVIEGSRCSRVNGRGWRCCQQTLVGYSLCEHHLGKGRLRSMTSVRSRSSAVVTALKEDDNMDSSIGLLSLSHKPQKKEEDADEEDEADADEEEEMLLLTTDMKRKKRKKIGMVKARSISSLLGQTRHADSTATTLKPAAIVLDCNNGNNIVVV